MKKEVKHVILHIFSHPGAGVEVTNDLLKRMDAIRGWMLWEYSQSLI